VGERRLTKYGDNGSCELCGEHDDNKGYLVVSGLLSLIRVSTVCIKCAKKNKMVYQPLDVINDPNGSFAFMDKEKVK